MSSNPLSDANAKPIGSHAAQWISCWLPHLCYNWTERKPLFTTEQNRNNFVAPKSRSQRFVNMAALINLTGAIFLSHA